jgi:hypothetical protein
MKPGPGDVFFVSHAASVQFAGDRAINVRVIRVDPRVTYVGYAWLDVYVLDPAHCAVERRSIFVQVAGLLPIPITPSACSSQRPASGMTRREQRI